jgi:hypothetical protein
MWKSRQLPLTARCLVHAYPRTSTAPVVSFHEPGEHHANRTHLADGSPRARGGIIMIMEDRFASLFGVGRGTVALYGPNGDAVERCLSYIERITASGLDTLRSALEAAPGARVLGAPRDGGWNTAWAAAMDAARDVGRAAAMDVALDAVRGATSEPLLNVALDAVAALIVWDVLPWTERTILISAWRSVFEEDPGCVPSVKL